MRVKLKNTALTSNQYGVLERATKAISSCVLQDLDIVIDDDHSYVINKNKL